MSFTTILEKFKTVSTDVLVIAVITAVISRVLVNFLNDKKISIILPFVFSFVITLIYKIMVNNGLDFAIDVFRESSLAGGISFGLSNVLLFIKKGKKFDSVTELSVVSLLDTYGITDCETLAKNILSFVASSKKSNNTFNATKKVLLNHLEITSEEIDILAFAISKIIDGINE